MIRMEQKNITGPMEKAEAQAITDRIRGHIDAAWADITRAYEGKAWKALGYSSWEAYVKAEFDMSRRRSYQLLDQGRVIEAVREVVGTDVHISEAATREIKEDLPTVTTEIERRIADGDKPVQAVKETVAAAREAKAKEKAEHKAEQAESNRRREEFTAKLPDAIKRQEQAKADAIAKRKAAPIDVDALIAEVEGLREANAALESEVAELRADNAKWEAMRVQFEQGGFEKVIAGKDAVISGLETRLYGESEDKASWMKSAKYWQEEAKKLGWKNGDITIDIETGEVVDG